MLVIGVDGVLCGGTDDLLVSGTDSVLVLSINLSFDIRTKKIRPLEEQFYFLARFFNFELLISM